MKNKATSPLRDPAGRRAYGFILLFGVVSLFGDVTYEGARSISGPYLALLGAGAVTVGWVGGVGEFIGYAFRLVSGYWADKWKIYWTITFIGYGLLITVPLLAFVHDWRTAALFLVLERFGKGVRTPAKDTMLSHAARRVGTGMGFALHEVMDSVGGVVGPLIFTTVFLLKGGYRQGFGLLAIPVVLCLAFLWLARRKVPRPEELDKSAGPAPVDDGKGFVRGWAWYWAFAFLSVAGLAHFQLMAYHFKMTATVPDWQIPLFYAAAMGMDAVAALLVGKWYDRVGLRVLLVLPVLTAGIVWLAFGHSWAGALAGTMLWGAVMAVQDTVLRATIADRVPAGKRGFAFGVFNALYGAAWLLGSVSMGWLYGMGTAYLGWFSVALELAALAVLAGRLKKGRV